MFFRVIADFARTLLETRPHPEQGYRSCLGLMHLARAYPAERMEAACRRALDIGAHSYRHVKTILSAILDRVLNNAHRITLKGGSMRRLYDSTKEAHNPPDHA